MNQLTYAFAAGIRAAKLALAPQTAWMNAEIARLEADLKLIKTNLETIKPKNRIIFTMTVSDDSAGEIKVRETDHLGVAVTPGALTATVDQPAKAAVAPDPNDPRTFYVTRLPASEGDPAILTVNVSFTDSADQAVGTYEVVFEPGKATTMTLEGTVASIPAATDGSAAEATPAPLPAVGDTVSLPSNPADPTSPPADHTVTAVDADASTVTAQPVSGGDPVTVPASSVAAAASA